MSARHDGTILISGGSSCLGEQIALALAATGAPLRLWLPRGASQPAAVSVGLASWERADAWNAASLRGRGRGAALLLHCIGSLRADETRGLSAKRQNFEAARNVVNMAMQDGVPQFLLPSAARPLPGCRTSTGQRSGRRSATWRAAACGMPSSARRSPTARSGDRSSSAPSPPWPGCLDWGIGRRCRSSNWRGAWRRSPASSRRARRKGKARAGASYGREVPARAKVARSTVGATCGGWHGARGRLWNCRRHRRHPLPPRRRRPSAGRPPKALGVFL